MGFLPSSGSRQKVVAPALSGKRPARIPRTMPGWPGGVQGKKRAFGAAAMAV
jgi:hypothetical protein